MVRIILANPIQSNIIRSGRFKLKIFTDASLTRSGAVIYEHIGFNHLRINKTTLLYQLFKTFSSFPRTEIIRLSAEKLRHFVENG